MHPVAAQLSPFPDVDTAAPGGRDLPEILPPDMIEPVINPRQTTADKIARIFNRDLRDIEETQSDFIAQLENLPRISRETQRITGFGYLTVRPKPKPKWIQIDMGEAVSPDAVALFPVSAEVDGEMVYGYGFPPGFRIDISDEEEFRNYETMVEGRVDDPGGVRRWPFFRELGGFSGRYIRVSATDLWRSPVTGAEAFALSEAMILKGGRNLAVGKKVVALDSEETVGSVVEAFFDRWYHHAGPSAWRRG